MPKNKVKDVDDDQHKLFVELSKDVDETFGSGEFTSLHEIEEYLDAPDDELRQLVEKEMSELDMAERIAEFVKCIRDAFCDAPNATIKNVGDFIQHLSTL